MARTYNYAMVFLPDGTSVDAEFYTYGRWTWGARLRGLRRWCERNGIAVRYPLAAMMGGNSWTAHDIANA